MTPFIPEVAHLAVVDAAVTYAQAGWYVLPVDPSDKNAGSILGKGWQFSSSRTESTIRAWWQYRPDAALALHVGRSGAVALDVDNPDKMPSLLFQAIVEFPPPRQQTRTNDPHRAHYFYAADPGSIGNALGDLGKGWGDVRGWNGVVVVAPTPHSKAAEGGCYRWSTVGALPPIPPYLKNALRAPSASGTVTSTQAFDFIANLPSTYQPCRLMRKYLQPFPDTGRHEESNSRQMAILRAGDRGHEGAAETLERLHELYQEALQGDREADDDWQRGLNGAVAIVVADPCPEADKGCCAPGIDEDYISDVFGPQALARVQERARLKAMSVPEDTPDIDIWNLSDQMRAIYTAAQNRFANPYAALHVVLAWLSSAIPHGSVVETSKGTDVLNYFVAVIGKSGAGKSQAASTGRDLIGVNERRNLPFELNGLQLRERFLGSGQGLLDNFMGYREDIPTSLTDGKPLFDKDGPPAKKRMIKDQVEYNAMLMVDEGRQMLALAGQSGSLVFPTLCSLWAGEGAGQNNANKDASRWVYPKNYAVGLVAGFQPETIGDLFADRHGGTPQRFSFVEAQPPWSRDMVQPAWPGMLPLPTFPYGKLTVTQDPDVLAKTQGWQRTLDCSETLSWACGEYDSHVVRLIIRVAALFALLHGQTRIDRRWLTAAETVCALSRGVRDRTAEWVVQEGLRARTGAVKADSRAKREGEQEADSAAELKLIEQTALRVQVVVQRLTAAGKPRTPPAVRRELSPRQRTVFVEALEQAVGASYVRVSETGDVAAL